MKKLLFILLMVIGCANYALPQNPYYYDDCWNNSIPFTFPLERVISDTVWYTATLDDVKKGISASWYSNVSVTMEVYAFCTSKTPSFTLTVEPNQLREMEIEVINKKLEAMGEMAQMMAQTLTPHIRIYPNKNSAGQGQGTVYWYPLAKRCCLYSKIKSPCALHRIMCMNWCRPVCLPMAAGLSCGNKRKTNPVLSMSPKTPAMVLKLDVVC